MGIGKSIYQIGNPGYEHEINYYIFFGTDRTKVGLVLVLNDLVILGR